jgi:hypothetical protein
MNAKEAIAVSFKYDWIVTNLLNDLSDADLLVRPVPGANHIAWQLGHLITSEMGMVKECISTAKYPELPAGFAEQHKKEKSGTDTGFGTKAQYLDLFTRVRQATVATIMSLNEADLDKPTTGNMAKFVPTIGELLSIAGTHPLMHSGQWTVVRRKLGKPVLF